MALIVPNDGKLAFLAWMFRTNDPTLVLHLYKNNYVPIPASVVGDFDEADYSGYTPETMANWDVPTLFDGVHGLTSPDTITFTRAAGGTSNSIYGYFVTEPTGLIVWWAEKFASGPYSMATAGQTIDVTAFFTDKSEF